MIVNPGLNPSAAPPPPGLGMPIAGAPSPAPPSPPPAAGTPIENEDGSVDFVDDDAPERAALDGSLHDANLAEVLDEQVLSRVASELLEGIEADRDSNQEMFDIFAEGMKLVVVKPGTRLDVPFRGAAGVVHPVLLEALVRFAANARGEMLPAAGPVQMQVFGDGGPQVETISKRKCDYMNYYLTEEDEEYYPDYDQMLVELGFYGSMFRKVYRDPARRGRPISRALSPYDLMVNYSATSLHGSARVTHIEKPVLPADIKRLQLQAWYRDVDLGEPQEGEPTPAEQVASGLEGRTPSDRMEDQPFALYHCHCLLDLEGLEHQDEDGEPTGLPLPYVVTIEPESRQVLRIARNWHHGDADYRPREYFVHYKYMHGFGFYGWGLVHLLGSTADALTMMRRQGLNSITLKTFPGGLRVRGAREEKKAPAIGPGEWHEIDTGGLPIQQAVIPLPYADLPTSFLPVLQEMLESGQRIGSIGDMAVGEGREDALPGTVIALIEQSVKLEASVMKRLHTAQRKELRLLADLFGADKAAKYPFTVAGQRGVALAADFADNMDIVPVSDPNVPTRAQRLSQAQAIVGMAQQSGGKLDYNVAVTSFLKVMGKSDAEIAALMPPVPQGQPSDPVTEFAMAMKGMPLAAGPQQNHLAHIQAHLAQLATPGLNKTPAFQPLMAHVGDHCGLFYAGEASRLTGMPILPGQVPPQMQDQVAAAVAAASNQLRLSLAQIAPDGGGDPLEQMKLQIEQQKIAQMRDKMQLEAAEHDRKAEQHALDQRLDWAKTRMEMADHEAQRQSETQINQNETARGLMTMRTAQMETGATTAQASMQRDATIAEKLVEHAITARRADADMQIADTGLKQEGLRTAAAVTGHMANVQVAKHEIEAEREAAKGAQAKARAAAKRPKATS